MQRIRVIDERTAGAAAARAHRLLRRGARAGGGGHRRRRRARARPTGSCRRCARPARRSIAGCPSATRTSRRFFGNAADVAEGRQLPCHPGTRARRLRDDVVVHRDPAAARSRHGVGGANQGRRRRRARLSRRRRDQRRGLPRRGATSRACISVPVVFFCQNNQWAISTPVSVQTAAPTIAIKALAYGFERRALRRQRRACGLRRGQRRGRRARGAAAGRRSSRR